MDSSDWYRGGCGDEHRDVLLWQHYEEKQVT